VFFKQNGAKKDRTWNERSRPDQVREQWCLMMNRALEREGIEQRVDPRSWADQGREDLDALKEPKALGGTKEEALARWEQIEALREKRQQLPERKTSLENFKAEESFIAGIEQRLNTQLAEIDRRMAVERAKQRAEEDARKADQRKTEKERKHAIERRAQELWEASAVGRAEMLATQRYEEDRLQEATLQKLLDGAQKELTDWKAAHPLKAVLGTKESRKLEADVAYWRTSFNEHQLVFQKSYEASQKHDANKKASWPELLRRAAEDLMEIAVRLILAQVRQLLRARFGNDRQAEGEALRNIDQGVGEVQVLDGKVLLQKNDAVSYAGILRAMDKPLLDAKLTELNKQEIEEQGRARRLAEDRSKRMGNPGTVRSRGQLSREELDRQLGEIAQAKAMNKSARIVPGEEIGRSEITGRVLGYTSGREEMLVQRLGGQLVRVPWNGKPPLQIGKQVDIDPRSGTIGRGMYGHGG